MECRYAGEPQALPRQHEQIGQPLSLAVLPERAGGVRVLFNECRADFITDFECRRSNARAEVSEQIASRYAHRSNSVFENAGAQAAPPGVGGSHYLTAAVAQQHRYAVGNHDHAYRIGRGRDRSIRIDGAASVYCIDDLVAMYLVQPAWWRWQHRFKPAPVLTDVFAGVPDRSTDIH